MSPASGTDGVTALFLVPDPSQAAAVEAALEQHGITVSVERAVDDALERVADAAVDCVVAPDDPPGRTGREFMEAVRARDRDVPVVLLTTRSSGDRGDRVSDSGSAEYVAGDIESVSYGRLADRIRALAARYRSTQAQQSERAVVERLENRIKETERKITALHGVAMRLNSTATVDGVYEETVSAAERILDLDICFAFAAEGDHFVPKARSSNPTDRELEPVPLDAGAMGETYRTGESRRAVDISLDDVGEAAFGSYRSGISVPVGSYGVFQAVSARTGAFDEIDVELAELLTAHADAALQRLEFEAQLRRERDHYAALFENSADCIIEAVFEGERSLIRSVNPAFEETFGYTEAEVAGREIDDVIVSPERYEEAVALTRQVREGDFVQAEVRRETRDGPRDFLLRSVPLDDDTMYAVYTDITDRTAAERALERQNERLDEFASVVSHDLRNPLTVAKGRLRLAREGCDSEHLERVARAHDRMEALTDDLLRLAREGDTALEVTSVSLADAAARAWESVETGAATLATATDRVVRADEGRLTQLLENLVRNAVEHSESAVTVTVGDLEDAPGFFVADDGPGIPAGEREAVFEPGVTSSDDGTGFGLAIVKQIADTHGWTVEAVPGRDGGSRFEFTGLDD